MTNVNWEQEARITELEALLTEARAAMQVFRNPMDVPNTDISESIAVDYVCVKIDALLGEGVSK